MGLAMMYSDAYEPQLLRFTFYNAWLFDSSWLKEKFYVWMVYCGGYLKLYGKTGNGT